ncbi:MAG: SDR family NAD(P)-dependent oxidoreductase [Rhodospirillaceae bacterium]
MTAASPSQGCAWVTGASSGIGAAVALRLARDGWTVAASARRLPQLQELAGMATGGKIVPMPHDVTDTAAVTRCVAEIEHRLGPIALAVLNAGTYRADSAETFSAQAVREMIELNFMGTVHGLGALLPRMIERGRGRIAVVSSSAGFCGLPRAAGYGATKAALITLCESLKFDLDPLGVAIQVVTPGFVRTPLTDLNDFPMPFIIDADAAADRLVAGLYQDVFEITFPRRFTGLIKLLRWLPYCLYFPLVRAITRRP